MVFSGAELPVFWIIGLGEVGAEPLRQNRADRPIVWVLRAGYRWFEIPVFRHSNFSKYAKSNRASSPPSFYLFSCRDRSNYLSYRALSCTKPGSD